MSITITVPNDDHVALRAMAKALEEIAIARGAPSQGIQIRHTLPGDAISRLQQATGDLMQAAPAMLRDNDVDGSIEIHGKRKQAEVDTTAQQFESLNLDGRDVQETAKMVQKVAPVMSDTDSTGTPWDERIHSASKALNADGSWRLRRKPKHMDDEQWVKYVEAVKTDETPNNDNSWDVDRRPNDDEDLCVDEGCDHHGTPHVCIKPEPSVTPDGDDFHVDASEVTEQEVAAIPAPPLPVPPTPPVHMSFPDVMKFLTERHARISNEQVTEIITAMGLKSIMDLNTQPEHTGPFIVRVKALLGE